MRRRVDQILDAVGLVVVTGVKDVLDKGNTDSCVAFTLRWLCTMLSPARTPLRWMATENMFNMFVDQDYEQPEEPGGRLIINILTRLHFMW